jgi:hypothetical protein
MAKVTLMSDATSSTAKLLFLSWNKENCGVHQYGRTVATALNAVHQSIGSLEDAGAAIDEHRPDVTIWNWHPGTLGKIVHPRAARHFAVPSICLLHEFDPQLVDGDFFDVFVMPDPTNTFRHPRFFHCGRAIAPYDHRHPVPVVPTIGSFGFGVGIKGYQRVLGLVSESYQEAVIRLHIPANWAVDPEGQIARAAVEELRSHAPATIQIEASHDWLDDEGLLNWLAKNTINVFPYDPVHHPGISSSTDRALAVRRPVAITKCGLFKHLRHLPICLESYRLKEIADRGLEPIEHLYQEWSYEQFRERWSMIADSAIDHAARLASQRADTERVRPVASEITTGAAALDEVWRWHPGLAQRLRFPFSGASGLRNNHSQAWQDIFVLTVLQGLKNGTYVEVGANDPRIHNNTCLLAEKFGWKGVSIEYDPSHIQNWAKIRPRDMLLTADAMAVDYEQAIPLWFGRGVNRIDYLQLDIEPSFNTLQVLKRLPLSTCRFSVITFETDVYSGDLRARDESRAILRAHGYEMIAPDIGVFCEPVAPHVIAFEDWWIDPAVVNPEIVAALRPLGGNPTLPQRLLFS